MPISIIIPVFNTEKYLPACLESILLQNYSDFEILLIDDGSTDESGKICDAYAQKDSRIRVFHKENGGVSSARNLGLDKALGEWVYFVDSDDELLPDGLLTLVNGIDDEVDVVLGGYLRINSSGTVLSAIPDQTSMVLSKKESLKTIYERYSIVYPYLGYMCIRLFRNKIIQSNHLRFDTSITIKEDTLFTVQYICRSNGKTRFDSSPVYRYQMREDSAMEAWKRGFDYKYIDSLYALIKMRKEIRRIYPLYCEINSIADEEVWLRYNKILNKMNSLAIHDDSLRNRIHHDVYKALGLPFFIRKKLRNQIRKWSSSN